MKPFPPLRLLAAACLAASLTGCEKKPAPAPVAPPPPTLAPASRVTSAVPTAFEAVTKHLDPGGSAYCYFNTDQVIEWLGGYFTAMEPVVMQAATSKMEPEGKARTETAWRFATQFVSQCGIKDLSGFGYSCIALEPGYSQEKAVFYHDPAKKDGLIWRTRSAEPNALPFLAYLPANSALATSGNTKLLPIWEEINRQAANTPEIKEIVNDAASGFLKATGLDLAALFGSLGPNYSTLLTLDEAHLAMIPAGQTPIIIPEPALTFWAQVQDDLLIKKLEETLSKNPMATKSDVEGWTLYTIKLPLPFPWLRPAVAWKPGTVALFSNAALLSEMLEVKAGKKPGLAASPEFIKLRKGMPESGEGFGYLAPVFQKTVQAIQVATAGGQDPVSKQLMDRISGMNRPSTAFSVQTLTEAGSVSIIHEKDETK